MNKKTGLFTENIAGTIEASSLQAVVGHRELEPSECMVTTGGGERVEELWHQFEEWFVPRNGFTPTKGDTRVEEMWQAYLCGRLDELQEHNLHRNVMRDALKDIQATLDSSGKFLEGVERERAQRRGAQVPNEKAEVSPQPRKPINEGEKP